jgi:hypothetical protein
MDDPRTARLVQAVLRCYPARWRRRHGDEAAELAALLIRDGTPAGSIAWSYLVGAARERLTPRPSRRLSTVAWSYLVGAVRERLTPRPSRRLSTVACALLVAACSLGVSVGLLASAAPARAASTSQAHAHAHCRPGSAEPVPGVIAAPGRPQVMIRVAGHGRSC